MSELGPSKMSNLNPFYFSMPIERQSCLKNSLYYSRNVYFSISISGGFNWHLDFFWEWLPSRARAQRLRHPASSYTTPAIAGGLFAIDKEWFNELGTYDEGMEVGS